MTTDESHNLVLLCPGQGAQHVGMGKSWHTASAAARDAYAIANDRMGLPLSTLCFEGPEEQLNKTDVAQAAIYATSVACCRALVEAGRLDLAGLTAAAGLSLGEYTALHLAGVFSYEDGLKLVQQRGRFMQEAAEQAGGSMVAVTGDVSEAKVNELCAAARGDGLLEPANFNSPMQVVVTGTAEACERAVAEAERMGLRPTPLAVAGAFHSPLMQPAADRMAEALDAVDFAEPAVPVLSNVTGEPHESDPAAIKQRLVEQIVQPVRWEQNVRWLVANVPGRYIEPAPGKVLTGLMRRIDKKTKVENFAEFAT